MLNQLLQSDLRTLVTESKKYTKDKDYPELKDALEKAGLKLRFLLPVSKTRPDEAQLIADAPEVLKPFLMACKSSHQKLRSAAISGLLNLIAHQAIHANCVKDVVAELLILHLLPSDDPVGPIKILQCVVNLVSTDKRFFVHGVDLWNCLQIQFKFHTSKDPSLQSIASAGIRQCISSIFDHTRVAKLRCDQGGDDETKRVFKLCISDAKKILRDLCSLVLGADPTCLTLDAAKDPPFLLELIDDVLGNFRTLFEEVTEIAEIVKAQICPLIVFILKDQRDFSAMLRVVRIILNLSRQFPDIIMEEAETIITRLILILDNSPDTQPWMKCFVLEFLQELINNTDLLIKLYNRYDIQQDIPMVSRILRSVGRYIQSSVKKSTTWESKPCKNDSKTRCLEMLVCPPLSDFSGSYPVTVAFSILIGVVDSVEILRLKSVETKDPVLLKSVQQFADNIWPSLLVMSFVLTKSRSDPITQGVLKMYQTFTQTCGLLELFTPQDTFLTELHKFAVPASFRKPSPHSVHTANYFTKKNVFTMKRILNISHQMANSLRDSWSIVLDTLDVLWTLLNDPLTVVVNDESSEIGIPTGKDEVQVLTSALTSLFSTSQYLEDDGVKILLKQLEKHARSKLFPPDVDQLTESNESYVNLYLSFGIVEMYLIVEANLHRINLFWPDLAPFFEEVCCHCNRYARYHGVNSLTKVTNLVLESKSAQGVQTTLLSSLAKLSTSKHEDVRGYMVDQLHAILQQSGHNLNEGWPYVLQIIRATMTAETFTVNPRHVVKTFSSLQYICADFVQVLNLDLIKYLIETIGCYGKPVGDVNIAITAVGGLLWSLSDFTANQLIPKTEGTAISEIWLLIFKQLGITSLSTRTEIRTTALRSMFGIINSHGAILQPSVWEEILQTLYRMLEQIEQHAGCASTDEGLAEYQLGQEDGKSVMMLVHHTRNTSAKQWNETRVIALEGVLRIFKTFIASLARDLNDITSHWKKLMGYITLYWDSDNIEIALAAVKAVETMLIASANAADDYPTELWDQGWKTYSLMVTTLSKKEKKVSHTTIHTFTTSIQNLFSRLQQKFRPSDVLIFLQILKPLAILPVEYQGELGPLQKVLCQIYEQAATTWSYAVPQITECLLFHISQTIDYPYEPTCFQDHILRAEKSTMSPNTIRRATWNPSLDRIDKNKLSHMERSLNTLGAIWLIDLPAEIRIKIFDDLVFVVGRCVQLKHILPDSSIWGIAAKVFVNVIKKGLIEIHNSQKPVVEINVLWADIIDSIQSYFMSPKPGKGWEEWDSELCKLLTFLIYQSRALHDQAQQTQTRLISILFDCSKENPQVVYDQLFTICKDITDDQSKAVAQAVAPLIVARCQVVLQEFSSPKAMESPSPELTQEVKFLLERLLTLDLPDTVKMIHSGKKAHLLELSPLFSECILSGDPQIRFYLKEIFKLITTEFINKK